MNINKFSFTGKKVKSEKVSLKDFKLSKFYL